MIELEVEDGTAVGITAEMIRSQLELLVQDDVFRSSKRSVAFLRYIVDQTLSGLASQIKERTIGVEVFDRKPTYDTNLDHIVRTAATELRKRLAIYYGDEAHRSELRMGLIPGSYIPRFTLQSSIPHAEIATVDIPSEPALQTEPEVILSVQHRRLPWTLAACAAVLLSAASGYAWSHRPTAQDLFWKPVLDTPGPVLLAIGYVPNGPPTPRPPDPDNELSTPIVSSEKTPSVPFGDAVTLARVVGTLETAGKKVVIRQGNYSSFSDLREGPVVLIGAFNNDWSLRLTRKLRYSLAMDAEKHLIYIKDSQNPASRTWCWGTNLPTGPHKPNSPALHDYALISRIRDSETGKVVVVLGGLYTYGTQSAGEFLSDPQLMQAVSKAAVLDPAHPNLQIVLGTTVTDDTPGPPKILAISKE